MAETPISFSFGRNWEAFVNNYFTDERVSISQKHILDFLGLTDLRGRYFLDVGCGSGLSSLAALRAGAQRVVSFDIDPYSVKTAQKLREREGNPDHWTILHGSVLDKSFLAQLQPADLLYSWGVLHHTGAMWEAIDNTLPLLAGGGVFYLALYTTTPESPYWISVKQAYNRASQTRKRLMEASYVVRRTIIPNLRARTNPFAVIRNYKRSRGMAYLTDVRDWLGGWPYEDASVDEVLAFVRARGLRDLKVGTGEANSEYLLERAS